MFHVEHFLLSNINTLFHVKQNINTNIKFKIKYNKNIKNFKINVSHETNFSFIFELIFIQVGVSRETKKEAQMHFLIF